MATRDQHEDAFRKNLMAAVRAGTSPNEEDTAWVTTMLFYAAVQAAEMELATFPDDECLGLTDHQRRLCRVRMHWPGDAATLYTELQQYSAHWRYHAMPATPKVRRKAWLKTYEFVAAIAANWPTDVSRPT